MTDRTRVAVVYGSRSVEHDVSVITAMQVMAALDPTRYEVTPVYITPRGVWLSRASFFTSRPIADVRAHRHAAGERSPAGRVTLLPDPNVQGLQRLDGAWPWLRRTIPIDVVVPVLHGTNGEDGSVQGLLDLADLPYVGSSIIGSALGLDKVASKSLFRAAGLPVVHHAWIKRSAWRSNRAGSLKAVQTGVPGPWFVKPVDVGSSIGVSRATTDAELGDALDLAFTFDERSIVETAVDDAVDVNCAVLGGEQPRASVLEKPVSLRQFLTFEEKYLRNAKAGMKGSASEIPADLPSGLSEEIRGAALQAFAVLGCRGLARVDFLVRPGRGDFYVNEINTLPGSYALHLWSASGVAASEVMDELIALAISDAAEKRATVFAFDSGVLERAAGAKTALG